MLGIVSMVAALGFAFAATDVQAQTRPLGPQDVLTLARIVEVRISPNGERVAYAVHVRDLDANSTTRSFWIARTDRRTTYSLPIDTRASHLRWRPDGSGLAYLAPDDSGTMQVWEYTSIAKPRQLTFHPSSVLSFEWSRQGRHLAYTAVHEIQTAPVADGAGVVIESMRFRYRRLLSGEPLMQRNAHVGDPPTRTELWILDINADSTWRASRDLSVSAYAWSPSGRMLAITGRGEPGRLRAELARHDLLLYRLAGDRLDVLQAGGGGDYLDNTIIYDQPFWAPDGRRIGYFRTDWRDRWEASPQLGVFSIDEGRTVMLIPDDELELYKPRPFWLDADTVLIENTYRGGRRLFAVALADASVTPIVEAEDWFDQHSFSRDGRFVAFTRERIDTPPNLYFADRAMRELQRLTDLHTALDGVIRTHVERVHWAGEDGVDVEGWLYTPSVEPPFPTMVFVHGGPTWVFGNRYEPYLPIWTHAFGVYAARGVAVFVPNYRGTGSYGKTFRTTSALDVEPVTDIIAGVDKLVRHGLADANRLSIAGHSHGCWLGALVAVRHRRFTAAACAEGAGNWTSTYGRNPGLLNLEIIEHYWGGGTTPYDEPERYQRLSPDRKSVV